jgi:hypothetical protein
MEALGSAPAGLTREEIATRTNIRLQSVCGVVAILLQSGIIRRKPTLSEEGYEVRMMPSPRAT